MRVLTTVEYYLPGFNGGGPIRSLANIVDWLGDEVTLTVVTRDGDLGDPEPYPGCFGGGERRVGRAVVHHLSPAQQSSGPMARRLRRCEHEVLYLDSFFSRPFTLKPLLLRRLRLIQMGYMLSSAKIRSTWARDRQAIS